MSRRPSPRRRPGRRPPDRYAARHGPPTPQGFTGPGFGLVYRKLFPDLNGAAKKRYFNDLSHSIVLAAAVSGAVLGLVLLGWFGGLIGLGAGLAAGESFVERNRFYRR